MQNIIQKIKKTFSFFSSRLFYFILGLSFVAIVYTVNAVTGVGANTQLTSAKMNEIITEVNALRAAVNVMWPNASVPPADRFGGFYSIDVGNGSCANANPITGGCSCPAGFLPYYTTDGINWRAFYLCIK